MKHQQILDEWLWKRYREPGMETYECVSFLKLYSELAWNMKGLYFWGTAINGFNGKWNLSQYFDIVKAPQQGDFVFYTPILWNPEGHCSVFDTVATTVAQNEYGGRSWQGRDAISLVTRSTRKIAGYMRPKILAIPSDTVQKRVDAFVKKHGLKEPSKTEGYTQFETLIILSKIYGN